MMRQVSIATAERHLRDCGLPLDELGRLRPQKAVAAAFQRSSLKLDRMSLGEFDLGESEERGLVRAVEQP